MAKSKLYFSLEEGEEISDQDIVRTKENWEKIMDRDGVDELTLIGTERDIGGDGFYCKDDGSVLEKGFGYCGKECSSYRPRNGKSGICKHYSHLYRPIDETIVIKRKEGDNG